MSDIVERLGDIYATDDHARGCQGREYECTCGYDERSAATAREAAAEITRLRALVDEARGVVEPFASTVVLLRDHEPDDTITVVHNVRLGDLRAARTLLDKMGEA